MEHDRWVKELSHTVRTIEPLNTIKCISTDMGIFDSLKAGVKNAANMTEEIAETSSLKSRISSLEYEVEKLFQKLGREYYEMNDDFEDSSKILCEKIKENLEEIEELKTEIGTNRAEGKAEREANWEAARSDDDDD